MTDDGRRRSCSPTTRRRRTRSRSRRWRRRSWSACTPARWSGSSSRPGSTARSRRCPGAKVLQERHAAGSGLTAPELAVLLAYTKLELQRALVASDVPDDPYLADDLVAYFPPSLRTGFDARARRAPAAAGDRRHRGRQRGREPRRDQLPVATVRRDRARRSRCSRAPTSPRATCSTPTATWSAIDALDLVVPAAVQDEMFLARAAAGRAGGPLVGAPRRTTSSWAADRRPVPAGRDDGHGRAPGPARRRAATRRPRHEPPRRDGVPASLATRVAVSEAALAALPAVDAGGGCTASIR